MMKTDPHHLVEEMNRQLKFRFWDEKYNTWVNDPLFVYPSTDFLKQGIVIQQFTGFRDSEGKDLYEGDIINLIWGGKLNKSEIKFKHGSFIAEYIDPEGTMSFHWLHSIKMYDCPVKIIGNIYEKETKLEEKES